MLGRKPSRLTPRVRHILRSVVVGILLVLSALIFTPLNLVNPTMPDRDHRDLAIVWTSGQPSKGDIIVASVSQSDVYLGQVVNADKDVMLLRSGTAYGQTPTSAYLGRVLIKIPLLGILLP